jgi:serine/threonine-protein kinase
MSPDRLGRFEILSVLGEGGSSVVYAAKDVDREVALKVLHPDATLEPKDIDRFLDEAEKMRRVVHPNLVPVLGAGILPDGRPFITMPRLRGRSLGERLGGAPLEPARALALFEGLCSAVAAVHDAGLVHRDIKPENVLWSEEDDRLVLLDLGIARDTAAAPSTTTQAGLTRGTPAYMAPERFFGKQASIKSDVYELALVLFVMLVGRLPWDPEDPRGRLSPRHPQELGVRLAAPLTSSLLRALSVDYEARPDTARALWEDIARSAADPGDPISTRAAPLRPRVDLATDDTRVLVTPQRAAAAAADAYGPHAHARTEAHPATPQAFLEPTIPSPGAPPMQSGPPGPVVEILAVGGSRPPPGRAAIASARDAAPSHGARASSGAGLLAMGAGIALVGAVAGAIATGALKLGGDGPRERSVDTSSKASAKAATESAAASPGPRDVFSSDRAPTPPPSADTSAEPSARPTAVPSPKPSAKAATTAPSAAPSGATSSATPLGPAPPACTELVALMCDPTSGARPEECTAWKNNVASWRAKLPPKDAAEVCQAALSTSKQNLPNRKNWKP